MSPGVRIVVVVAGWVVAGSLGTSVLTGSAGCVPPGKSAAAAPSPAKAAKRKPASCPDPADPGAAPAVSPASVDELIGVWGTELVRGPTSTGPIELSQQGGAWMVSALGKQGACQPGAGSIGPAGNGGSAPQLEQLAPGGWWCRLGDSGHLLRLAAGAPSGEVIEASWVQPAVPLLSRGGYLTPVTLRRKGAAGYSGSAALLPMRLRVVLAIGKRPNGEIYAFLREREQNLGRLVGVMEVRRRGDEIELASPSGMALPARLLPAAGGDAARPAIELPLPDSDIVLRLSRLARGDSGAEEMFPSKAPPYAAPPASDDGWEVASLAEVGASSAPLDRMVADMARQVPGTWSDLAVHSVVVARRGKLVFEQYFAGYGRDDVHDVRSVGKSFTSTLAGVSIDRRELRLDDGVTSLVASPANADARWARVKLRHLLSMSGGLACDDDVADSPGNEDRVQDGAERDWHRAALALPMAREPGAVGVYCTMGINLTGALLARRSGPWLPELLIERLVRPLQMRGYFLNLMPNGQGYLGGGFRLRPRDMAKLGQIFVDKGLWNGKRLLSASWVAQATSAQASLSTPDDYGYGWWRRTFEYDRASYPAFYASGNGGQLIIGIPALEAVVVFTAGNYANRRTWQRLMDDYVPRYVIPALLGRP